MTNFNGLKKVTVWLMLLGILCVGVIPGDALAKKFIEIDIEGDPGDGTDIEDGGAGSGGSPAETPKGDSSSENTAEFTQVTILVGWNFYQINLELWMPSLSSIGRMERRK